MYRQYEDPHKLEMELKRVKKLLEVNPFDEDWQQKKAELEERINFAWQDDEYESEGM
jgi:hypothetical protein